MTPKHPHTSLRHAALICIFSCAALAPITVMAQTGVDDDRVSLPEGPGSLEGVGENVEIDPNMAMMRWGVPVDVPRGFPGVTPSLRLSYASGSGSGMIGIGWSMGVPSIERMTSKGVPVYGADDLFAMGGGEELVEVAQEGGDRIFRERFEGDFVRYTWKNVGDGAEGYWIAEFPDGRKGYFGADSGGDLVASARTSHPDGGTYLYHMVEVVDPFGNTLRYDYDAFGGNAPLVVGARYVFVGDEARYSVLLDYETREDLISDCGAGFEEVLGHRLAAVRVLSGTEIVREYVLDYEPYNTSGGQSRLRQVRTFSIGGQIDGEQYPVVFSFEYSQGLGVQCEEGDEACGRPFLVDMGTAASLGAGNATLLDINGDALPDILDSSQNGPHRFFINRLTPNDQGGFDHGFDSPVDSAIVTDAGTLRLSAQNIQTLDINGDGFSDIFNTATGNVLFNGGDGDWLPDGETLATNAVPDFTGAQFVNMRFVDFDNDKRIDIIRSTPDQTQIFRNDGTAYSVVDEGIELIGVGFAGGNLQLSDMNGDGLNDPVEVQEGGNIRFRLNLGRGKWGPFQTIPGVGVDPAEQDFVELEDLNNDGLSDIVIVVGTVIKYALNRNANNFDPFVTIDSDDIDGDVPDRAGKTVLFADMNGNGSEDIVWIDNSGRVQYLEMFPIRPNLISRIENGIGMVQKVTYGTSVEHAARAEAAGEPWDVTLPNAMAVVDKIDLFVTLTGDEDGSGVHEVIEYTYRNGFYDGQEKQFRGFTDVVSVLQGDAFQEEGTTRFAFDNGQGDPARNGLLLAQAFESDGRMLSEVTHEYGECAVDEIPSADQLRFPIKHVCKQAVETVLQEGAAQNDWVTTRTEMTYDGYGNVSLEAKLGVVARGGVPCGTACEGDEMFRETVFAAPEQIWLLGNPTRTSIYTDGADDFRTDVRYFYDGDPFVGLPEGQLTHGFLSRQTARISPDSQETIEVKRMRRDAFGNTVETIDPNGSPDEPDAHRRTALFDDSGLFLTQLNIFLSDPTGQPYQLRREIRFEPQFQNMIESTDHMLVRDGQVQTPANSIRFRYDDFGRITAIIRAGDSPETPTEQFAYEFGDPVTRVAFRRRSAPDGPVDQVTFRCFDGKGRLVQDRAQIAPGQYQVSGFVVYNNRGAIVESYQPFLSDSPDCDTAPPGDVLSTRTKYDAAFRPREVTSPDDGIYGTASVARTDYGPLLASIYDNEDNDPDSPHFDTPTIKLSDGLGRLTAIERTINTDGDGVEVARHTFEYDNIGNLVRIIDPESNTHSQTFDLLGRTISVDHPNSGLWTYTYDNAGNRLSRTDARGITVVSEYDGANRRVARFEQDNRQATESTWRFDVDPDCPIQECTHTPGLLASTSYPLQIDGLPLTRGSDRFGYDVRSRTIFHARDFGIVDLISRTTYDNVDQVVARTLPDGTELSMDYDASSRLTAIGGYIQGVQYEDRGLIESVTFTNGAEQVWAFDDTQRLVGLTHRDGGGQTFASVAFSRNRNGHLLQREDTGPELAGVPNRDLETTYDDWYRPLAVGLSGGTADEEMLTTTYSFIGNILTRTSSLGAASPAHAGDYAYDGAGPQAATQVGPLTLDYDAAGHTIQRGALTLDWDHLGRMTRTTRFQAAYNGGEGRVLKVDDGEVTLYGPGRFEVRDGVGTTYVNFNGDRVARRESADFGAALYPDAASDDQTITAADAWATWAIGEGLIEGDDEGFDPELVLAASARRLLVENEDAKAFLHTDRLGSITAATDEGGQVRGQRGFYPFGQQRWGTGFVDAYGFTGQERDRATGLVHFQFRYFDAGIGRWSSADPAFTILGTGALEQLAEATGSYSYVSNNPLNTIDPLGLKGKKKSRKGKKGKKTRKKKVRFAESEVESDGSQGSQTKGGGAGLAGETPGDFSNQEGGGTGIDRKPSTNAVKGFINILKNPTPYRKSKATRPAKGNDTVDGKSRLTSVERNPAGQLNLGIAAIISVGIVAGASVAFFAANDGSGEEELDDSGSLSGIFSGGSGGANQPDIPEPSPGTGIELPPQTGPELPQSPNTDFDFSVINSTPSTNTTIESSSTQSN